MGKKLTTEEFIIKSRKVHGDKYDYSKVEYINGRTKVIIICPIHGEFEQRPKLHLKDNGCAKCVGKFRYDTISYIEKAKEVHCNKYNYSKVKYDNSRTKVSVICPEHGEFQQTPSSHLSGHGCPECNKYKPTKKFISKAREVHGNKYDYSKVEYGGKDKKITIICPVHGEFKLLPKSHFNGNGCNTCNFIQKAKTTHGNKYDYSKTIYVGGTYIITIICPVHGEFKTTPSSHIHQKVGCYKCSGKISKYTTETFIEKAREVHGNKYNYSKVVFKTTNENIIIICPEHGEFQQMGQHHLKGSGCKKCFGNYEMTTEEFIQKAKTTHGNKYDYSKTNYINGKTKVNIICREHDDFSQTPLSHLNGSGCPTCQNMGINRISYEEAKKIIKSLGLTSHDAYYEWWEKNKVYCQKIGLPKGADNYYKNH